MKVILFILLSPIILIGKIGAWIIALDELLCEKTQEVSDWLQVNTGKTCFWFAYVLSAISGLMRVGAAWFSADRSGLIMSAVVFGVVNYTIAVVNSRTSPSRLSVSPLTEHHWGKFVRCLIISGAVGNLIGLVIHQNYILSRLCSLFDITVVYLICCVPLPGDGPKAGKWLDRIADKIFGKLVPQGT